MMHTQIRNKKIGCKCMSGFIILDVTSIRYVKAPDKKKQSRCTPNLQIRKKL